MFFSNDISEDQQIDFCIPTVIISLFLKQFINLSAGLLGLFHAKGILAEGNAPEIGTLPLISQFASLLCTLQHICCHSDATLLVTHGHADLRQSGANFHIEVPPFLVRIHRLIEFRVITLAYLDVPGTVVGHATYKVGP